MSFNRILGDLKTAEQIANLINANNNLVTIHDPNEVYMARNEYIVETLMGRVIGCVRVQKQSYSITEIKHLCVIKEFRGHGLAKLLIKTGLNMAQSPLVYATVRKDNIGSIKAFESTGFINATAYQTVDRLILCLVSTAPKWLPNRAIGEHRGF